MTDRDMIDNIHGIEWDRPIRVTVGGTTRIACRLCIAHRGLRAEDHHRLFKTVTAWRQHMRAEHPDVEPR